MEAYSEFELKPGSYQFRMAQYLPWVNVRVYRESPAYDTGMKARLAGVEVDALKLFNHGQWRILSD